MVKIFFRKIMYFTPIPFLVVAANYLVDPANLYNKEYEIGLARLLLEDKNVANVFNYDERLVQQEYILGLNKEIDIIILGSSRSLQIGGHLFQGSTFFNHSVPGASVEDMLAILGLYHSIDAFPHTIIISVDPWLFNRKNDEDRWRSISQYYYDFSDVLNISVQKEVGFKKSKNTVLFNKLGQLISISYFQESLKYIINNKGNYYVTDSALPEDGMIRYDGVKIYPNVRRNVSQDEINSLAMDYINKSTVYGLNEFREIDENKMNSFKTAIQYLLNEGITVVLFYPPYHPYVYDYLKASKDYRIIVDIENTLRDYAEGENIQIIGSYDPMSVGLREYDFYDGAHPKYEAIAKLFAK